MKLYTRLSDNPKANTSDIQESINALSYSNDRTLVLPAGLILVDRLFFYYDPILNPGFNPNTKQGLINLVGQGTIDVNLALSKQYRVGTVLKSTYTGTGACFSTGGDVHNVSPYASRSPTIKDLTLVANNLGHVLEANSPEFHFNNIKIVQEHKNGSGLKIGAFWFATMERVYILSKATSPTGIGMSASLGTGGGLLSYQNSLIDGFHTGILFEGSNYFDNFNLIQSAIQHCEIAIRNTTRIISLGIQNVHFEGNSKDIQSDAEIDNLNLNSVHSALKTTLANSFISLNYGVRILVAQNITLREGKADWIDLKKNTSALSNHINITGVNYYHDIKGTITKPVINITNNGSGLCRLYIDNHRYLSGRKIILKNTPYDGEYFITVAGQHYIDLVGSTFTSNSSGGECTLICHVVNNIDNLPNINVSAITGTDWGVNFVREKT